MTTSDEQPKRVPDPSIDPDTGLPHYLKMSEVWDKVVLSPSEAGQFLTNISLAAQDPQSDAMVHLREIAHALGDPATWEKSPKTADPRSRGHESSRD